MSRRPTGRPGAGVPGLVRSAVGTAIGAAVLVWFVARLFAPEAADRVAGDVAESAGTVAARAVTGFAEVLTGWLTETLIPESADLSVGG